MKEKEERGFSLKFKDEVINCYESCHSYSS